MKSFIKFFVIFALFILILWMVTPLTLNYLNHKTTYLKDNYSIAWKSVKWKSLHCVEFENVYYNHAKFVLASPTATTCLAVGSEFPSIGFYTNFSDPQIYTSIRNDKLNHTFHSGVLNAWFRIDGDRVFELSDWRSQDASLNGVISYSSGKIDEVDASIEISPSFIKSNLDVGILGIKNLFKNFVSDKKLIDIQYKDSHLQIFVDGKPAFRAYWDS